jgi:hypothetical protein
MDHAGQGQGNRGGKAALTAIRQVYRTAIPPACEGSPRECHSHSPLGTPSSIPPKTRLATAIKRQVTLAEAPPLPPKISDMELLSIVCQLGRAATETSIRHAINERIGRDVSIEWVRDRIAEIEAAGLAYHQHLHGTPSVRLTALGVERLDGVADNTDSGGV